ncbi:MAG: hypothetical protein KatS3mg068_2585 [Candidatus Sericytochromatia bacterium]|nr:MAG: hypothetical protein KatS3mg068_2585 [Candidatus Sericytochromatia bacterium]
MKIKKKLKIFLNSLFYFSYIDRNIINLIIPLINISNKRVKDKLNDIIIDISNFDITFSLNIFSKDEILFLLENCILICSFDGLTSNELLEINKVFRKYDISEDEITNLCLVINQELNIVDVQSRISLLINFVNGYIFYIQNGYTPYEAYVSMRLLFYITNTRFNNIVALINSYISNKYFFENEIHSEFFGILSKDKIKKISEELYINGYYLLGYINENEIEKIKKILLSSSFKYRNNNDVIKDIETNDYINQEIIKKILFDDVLIAISQNYIGSIPVLEGPISWITYYKNGIPFSDAAQLFHCDMDRLRQLKLFIMITDVDSESGPHVFVKNSHKKLPFSLLRDGRYSDQEVYSQYNKNDIIEFCLKKGAVLLEDTRGLHKGMEIKNKSKNRIIFQICYSMNLFGQNYDKFNLKIENCILKYKESCKSFRFFS